MQLYEPIKRPSNPGSKMAGLYRNIQLIMFLKNLFVLTNQIEILYFEFIKRELEIVTKLLEFISSLQFNRPKQGTYINLLNNILLHSI